MSIPFPQRLLDGYASFRAGRYAAEAERYRRLGEGLQTPTIMMIACCDSRAAPETIFDAGPGEIFVVRNVANLVPPYAPDGRHHSTSAALEFAVLQLNVAHIVIMGHGRCGGIRAITEPGDPLSTGDFIGKWLAGVRDVAETVEHHHGPAERLTLVEQASVEHSLANLRTFPWVRVRESKRQLTLNGAWFDISQGELNVFVEAERRWTVV